MAAQVVKAARIHDASVTVLFRGCGKANARSILELLMLGAPQGVHLEIEADGTDEDQALRAVADVFQDGAGI